jgi:protein-S-isoprenylcysteine O-methyltransferase Ste14
MMIACHLFVIGYEEPTLRRRFGDAYNEYLGTVSRWITEATKTRQISVKER